VIDEARNGSSSGVDDHLIVEAHEVVTLPSISQRNKDMHRATHFVFLIDLLHASLTFGLRDDLSSVFHDDLMRPESSHSPYTVASILGIQYFHTVVIAVAFGTSPQLCERPIAALLSGKSTVRGVTFIRHDTIVTGVSTTIFCIAVALRGILLVALPQGGRIANEPVFRT
jgi:hypothetical protein